MGQDLLSEGITISLLGTNPEWSPLCANTSETALYRFSGGTDGHTVVETQRASVAQVTFVAFIDGNDERHMPALGSQTEQADGIVGSIKGSGEDGQAKKIPTTLESGHTQNAVVTIAVGDGDDKGKLTGMAQAVSR